MFMRWKRISGLKDEIIDAQANRIRLLSTLAENYKHSVDNIISNSKHLPDSNIYTLNQDIYYIYSQTEEMSIQNAICEYRLFTYKLNSDKNDCYNWICKSESEIRVYDHTYCMKINNIDTCSEGRSGHASRQLKKIILYARNHEIHKIYGRLLPETYIGTDNLIHFYERNGFVVDKDVFYMNL